MYNLPGRENSTDVPKNRPLNEEEKKAASIELQAIQAAEVEEDFAKALSLINKAIAMSPEYPSPYNNRAQIYRLMEKDEESVLADLNKAISLSNDDFPRVKAQALCQRAWLKYSKGEMADAYVDFESSSTLGCSDAKKMTVRCNPYARLCNNIMREMLQRLYFSKQQEKEEGNGDD